MLRDCKFELSYSSGLKHGPKEFFTEALIESKSFDLGLGFFSTSGIRCLAYGFALFIANGGRMRVVINNILSEQDKLSIEKGQSGIIDSFEGEQNRAASEGKTVARKNREAIQRETKYKVPNLTKVFHDKTGKDFDLGG